MFLEQETLSEALTYAKLRELPKKFNPELGLEWIMAVGLIKKSNLMTAYAIIERRADGVIQYKKVFGRLSRIDSLISVYPFMYVDPEALEVANKTDRSTLALKYNGLMDQIMEADDEQLKVYRLQYAMDMQKLNMNQEKPRFTKSIVEEAENEAREEAEPVLKENETVAFMQDEGEVIMEVVDAEEAFRPKRGRKTKNQK